MYYIVKVIQSFLSQMSREHNQHQIWALGQFVQQGDEGSGLGYCLADVKGKAIT